MKELRTDPGSRTFALYIRDVREAVDQGKINNTNQPGALDA